MQKFIKIDEILKEILGIKEFYKIIKKSKKKKKIKKIIP